MDKTWPNAVLSEKDKRLLREAVEPDLRDLEKDCTEKSAFDKLDKTTLALGRLGQGILVSTNDSCACGGTGNCAVYLYVREKEHYREVLHNGRRGAYSWAFAVVDSKTDVPDLVLAGNAGGFEVILTKYQYVGDKFVPQECETLKAKNADSPPKSWWNPSEVIVQPCQER